MANGSSKERTKSLIPRTWRAGARRGQECAACPLRALLSLHELGWLAAVPPHAKPRPPPDARGPGKGVCEGMCVPPACAIGNVRSRAGVGRPGPQRLCLPGALQFPPSGGLGLPFPGPRLGVAAAAVAPPVAFGALSAFPTHPHRSLALIVLSL